MQESLTSLHSLGTGSLTQYDYMGSTNSLGTLQPGEEDFHGSLTSLNTEGLGTQRDDLTGSLTSLESYLDPRPRLSPINSIMEGNEENDEPHLSVQASELRKREGRRGRERKRGEREERREGGEGGREEEREGERRRGRRREGGEGEMRGVEGREGEVVLQDCSLVHQSWWCQRSSKFFLLPTPCTTHTPPPPHPALMRYQSPRDGKTALHKAVSANQSENVNLLLSADPRGANIQDKAGNTPLHLACQLGHKRCLRVILVRFEVTPLLT